MLKGIPEIISPDLMKILMEMGHGDDLVIGDVNFPAASNARRLVRCDGHDAPPLLDAILRFFPLDTFVEKPVTLMSVVKGTLDETPKIWEEYRRIVKQHCNSFTDFEYIDRFEFYERARTAYSIIATSERALYGVIILKKGVF